LKCFSFCWKQYILVPFWISALLNQWWDSSWKSGWESQNFSNLKCLSLGVAIVSTQRWTNQWSEPSFGGCWILLEGLPVPNDIWVGSLVPLKSLTSDLKVVNPSSICVFMFGGCSGFGFPVPSCANFAAN
jgi:hypothetical protein